MLSLSSVLEISVSLKGAADASENVLSRGIELRFAKTTMRVWFSVSRVCGICVRLGIVYVCNTSTPGSICGAAAKGVKMRKKIR